MNLPGPTVSVALPVSQAMEWTKRVLFQPFDLYRWLVIGFTAWLASLGDWSGGSSSGGAGGGSRGAGTAGNPSPLQVWEDTRAYLFDNFVWLVPTAILVMFVAVALGLLILWLSSRGRFMFLHNVARNQADIVVPWHAYRQHGNSLFLFRLVVAIAGFVLSVPFLVLLGLASLAMIRSESLIPGAVLVVLGAGLGLILIAVAFALIEKLTKDFVVPIMWLRQPSCLDAWKEFQSLLRPRLGDFALYILFHILLTLGAGVLILLVAIMTCCIAGCLFALPYLGTVFLLPVFVFFRSYSLLYLAQYGSDYNVFQPQPAPVAG
jgi:hypothetical protein